MELAAISSLSPRSAVNCCAEGTKSSWPSRRIWLASLRRLGLTAVACGPDSQALVNAYRKFWTSFFRNFWKIQDYIKLSGELWEPVVQCFKQISTTLTSLADGADLLLTGGTFEEAAAVVAEYYDIPLATLHSFPERANGQLIPILPSPLARSAMTVNEWLYWRKTKKLEDAYRRELGLPKATVPLARRIAERGWLEIQAYDEVCFPGLATEWAKWNGGRPFVGALTMELTTDGDDDVASWIAAGTPPIYFGFGWTGGESAADTVAMISAACAQLGERALVCAGGSDFSHVPHFDHVKVVDLVNLRGRLSGLPRGRPPRWYGHHGRRPARRNPHADPFDGPLSDGMGSAGQTTEGGHRPALIDHHPEIAGRGSPPDPRPAIRHPSPRDRHPDDQSHRKRCGRSRSGGKLGPASGAPADR